MKFVYSILLLCFSGFFLNAQDANFEWVQFTNGAPSSSGTSIITDQSGNVYTLGVFSGSVDLDPSNGILNVISNGSHDFFIQKLTSNGNLVWAKSFGGQSSDGGSHITIDTFGNLYITGIFRDSVDFDPSSNTHYLYSNGISDIFVLKLDTNGNFLWAKNFGDNNSENPGSCYTNNTGNIYGSYSVLVCSDG